MSACVGRLVTTDRWGREGRAWEVSRGVTAVGRHPACEVRLPQPAVQPRHATLAAHDHQTVVRNVGEGVTLVNGRAVTAATLRHGDVITVADRHLRWEYHDPHANRDHDSSSSRRGRRSVPAVVDRTLQLALEMRHRASAPGSTGGKQVAIVQPQRRDTNGQVEPESRSVPAAPRGAESPLQSTKASLWIESRKSGPRRTRHSAPGNKTTPLRLTVLRRAQTQTKLIKIEAPLTIDHTKQAAIMLMTGHTPKSKSSISPKNRSSTKKSPSYVVKKSSPVRGTPRGKSRQSGRKSRQPGRNSRQPGRNSRHSGASSIGVTPSRGSTFAQDSSNSRSSKRNSGNRSVTILEITDSTQDPTIRASDISTRSNRSPRKPLSLSSPKKSAMKDHSKKNTRKTESIKFDLSNLERQEGSEDEMMLRYSESSEHSTEGSHSSSRGGKGSHRAGASATFTSAASTLTPRSPRARNSIRGSATGQKALESTTFSDYTHSDLSTKTIASAFRTRTLSPRPDRNLESYSVVDLISFESRDTSKSEYDSAGSETAEFGTPPTGGRTSTIGPALLGSSTPYVGTRTTRSKSSSNLTRNESVGSVVSTRRSKSLSTPENKHISVNSTRVSRASRSRSRINDSDLLLLDDTEVEDSSPRTSKRSRTTKSVTKDDSNGNATAIGPDDRGIITPENRYSPEAAGTPVLSIQSLLDSSRSSLTSQNSGRRGRRSVNKRKTIGVISGPRGLRGPKSKSVGGSVRKTRLRLSGDSGASSDRTDEGAPQPDDEEIVTPKSAVKISPEDVKNKHSTAKKPQSKRSIIDDLNRSDIVKQLFNSPVKRKLSQSMTEFSRKRLFDDDDVVLSRRPTRNTIALTGRSSEYSILDQNESITPEQFVSPIGSPNSSHLSESRNARVKYSVPTPRARGSIRNDLTNMQGVKAVFAKSPRNRLSDVRVKEAFAASPNDDLRRVSGVKSLFQMNTSPKNDLSDVRGVKRMFKRKSPENDLRNVSGVKRTLRNATPKNDLTDVRGVRRMFRQEKRKENYHDVSGIEELFDESDVSVNRSERLFDMLVGKPPIRSVYSKTFSAKTIRKPRKRRTGSLRSSVDVITNNVERWLEEELQKRLRKNESSASAMNATAKELQKLATDTVGGGEPILLSRTRNSSLAKSASETYSAHTLPIKKRSVVGTSFERGARRLPIKKRVVLHSTPVKGRHFTLNASELGRVSPITADVTADRSTRTIPEERTKGPPTKAKTPRKQETPKKIEITEPSPPRSPEQLIVPKRATRNRKNAETSRTKTQKKRNSLVVPKKAPVMSPKPAPKAASQTDPKKDFSTTNPKRTRAARGKKEQKIVTPKTTRTRATKTTVVVAKPTPNLKPQSKEKLADKSRAKVREDKPNRTRKTTAVETEADSLKVSPKNVRKTRGRAVANELQIKSRNTKPQTSEISKKKPAQAKRGRIEIAIEQPVLPSRRRKTNAVESSVLENTKTRRGKASAVPDSKTEQKQPKGRGNKVETEVSVRREPATRARGKKVQPVAETLPKTRNRKVTFEVVSEEKPNKTRGKKVETQTSVISEPTTRSRRNKGNDTVATETKGRKRKAVADEEIPSKIAKVEPKAGKKAETLVTSGKQKRAVTKSSEVENSKREVEKSTRGTRSRQVEQVKSPVRKETKPGRGRKATEPQEKVVETAKRKRKAKVEPSPAKAAKKPATKATMKQVPHGAPARRGKPAAEVSVPTAGGRSRRR